jgi:hypothetical protein
MKKNKRKHTSDLAHKSGDRRNFIRAFALTAITFTGHCDALAVVGPNKHIQDSAA